MKEKKENKYNRLYNDLTWMFPIITPLRDYEAETEYYTGLIKDNASIPVKKLLHLGCGAGHNDNIFKRHFEVTGVDISAEMLKMARKLNPEVRYIQGDMGETLLKEKFDCILSVDAMDYNVTEDDFRRVFANAYAMLNEGGLLFFLLEKLTENYKPGELCHYTNRLGDTEVTYIEHRYASKENPDRITTVMVYIIKKGDDITVEHDLHLCGLHSKQAILDLLKEAGFSVQYLDYIPPKESLGGYEFSEEKQVFPMFVCRK